MIPDVRIPASLQHGPPHLYVIGPNTPEVVDCVGGWIFDRAMAGWDVTVFIPDHRDVRPLRILGAQADDYRSAVVSTENCPGRMALAVAAEVYDDDASVHGLVRTMLDEGSCEVAIWGNLGSADLGSGSGDDVVSTQPGGRGVQEARARRSNGDSRLEHRRLGGVLLDPRPTTATGMVYAEGHSMTKLVQGRVTP